MEWEGNELCPIFVLMPLFFHTHVRGFSDFSVPVFIKTTFVSKFGCGTVIIINGKGASTQPS